MALAAAREESHARVRLYGERRLRSAAAAGLHVIAIPHPKYPPDPDALAAAALVLPALADLTPAAVAALA